MLWELLFPTEFSGPGFTVPTSGHGQLWVQQQYLPSGGYVLPGVMSGTKGLKYHHASRNRVANLKVKLVGSRYDVENSVSLVLLCVVLLFSEFFNLSSLLFNMI